jgi:hypothetical protein
MFEEMSKSLNFRLQAYVKRLHKKKISQKNPTEKKDDLGL